MIKSIDAARKICELGDWEINNLKLQKILYLIHLVSLGMYNKPLIKEKFEAWDFGPVEPDLYDSVKFFGAGPIKFIPKSKEIECEVINEVFEYLKNKTGAELVQLTHRKNGAWYKTKKGMIILDKHILEEYEEFSKS